MILKVIVVTEDRKSVMGEYRVYVDQRGKQARLSDDQQLSGGHAEGSGAKGIRFDDGVFGGFGVREN